MIDKIRIIQKRFKYAIILFKMRCLLDDIKKEIEEKKSETK